MKQDGIEALPKRVRDSPASNGGRGLKPRASWPSNHQPRGFARQQWRAWIETKKECQAWQPATGFARQQWRAWIETMMSVMREQQQAGFARQQWRAWIAMVQRRCGRKRSMGAWVAVTTTINLTAQPRRYRHHNRKLCLPISRALPCSLMPTMRPPRRWTTS